MSSPLRAVIVARLADPLDVKLAESLFGTSDPEVIAARVERYCAEAFGASVSSCDDVIQSVGAVFLLHLEDGQRVVLKGHGEDGERLGAAAGFEALVAVYGVQAELARRGFPCPPILRAPRRWEHGSVAAMAYLEAGAIDDPHAPLTRRALAETCARVVHLAADLRDTPHLSVSRLPPTLFPKPHNVLFAMDAPNGEWIDERARAARVVLDHSPSNLVLAHTDVSAANVRVCDGRACAVYDMDSLALIDEPRLVAGAAVHFTYTGGTWVWPSRDEARAFVEDYQRARGTPFTAAERERLNAAAIYSLSYTARCEHSLDPEERETSMRTVLRAATARDYLV